MNSLFDGAAPYAMRNVRIRSREGDYGAEKARDAVRRMAEQGAVCLYESPRAAKMFPAAEIPFDAAGWEQWWEECSSCLLCHAAAELRLEKTPFTQNARGRLLEELADAAPGSPDTGAVSGRGDACIYAEALARTTSYFLRRHANIRCRGRIVCKEYFQANEDGMLLCRHTRTAGLAQED